VRKLGKQRGGDQIKLPSTIEELLDVGGKALGIQAKAVRNDQEAHISDITLIFDGQILFLTTEKEEEQF
jgi:hypothetical protein